ncbi:lytic polysaccharide monooxygenase [Streptomyces goshikiensis]|uniref:lytic polysaccharide monooxygenase n=1 Tax=Streptomyces goshikiensis TaxID=1942 RepID=UPI0036AEC61B
MKKIQFPVAAAVLALAALVPQSAAASGPEQAVATDTVSSRSAAARQPLDITPASRQSIYLYGDQVGVRGGKFINTTLGGQSDRDVPSDIVNRMPPPDGQIVSAGNPYASKLDGVRDEYGNEWHAHSVRNGEAMTVSVRGLASKIRRVSAYMTKANWDPFQRLTRAQFDLSNPAYTRTYTCAPYYQCDGELPWGLTPPNPHEFSFNLPYRSLGHHVILLEIDHPDSGEATYQVIDLRYVN